MHRTDLVVRGWKDYELIDSGNDRKLERFGQFLLVRPETQALWSSGREKEWGREQAEVEHHLKQRETEKR